MSAPSFDSTHAVRFDLAEGAVRTGTNGDRVVLAEAPALAALLESAPAAVAEEFARSCGAAVGRRAAARLGPLDGATTEAFLTQLAGEAALAGLGALSLERWGRAMVVVVQGSPLPAAQVAPFVSAAFRAAAGRAVWCTLLLRDAGGARVLVSSELAVAKARDWIASGVAWSEVLGRLQGARA
jgi:hypothetical protein